MFLSNYINTTEELLLIDERVPERNLHCSFQRKILYTIFDHIHSNLKMKSRILISMLWKIVKLNDTVRAKFTSKDKFTNIVTIPEEFVMDEPVSVSAFNKLPKITKRRPESQDSKFEAKNNRKLILSKHENSRVTPSSTPLTTSNSVLTTIKVCSWKCCRTRWAPAPASYFLWL